MGSNLKSNAGYSNNYVEYLVPKKNTTGTLLAKIGIVAGLIIVYAILFAIISKYAPPVLAVMATIFLVIGWYLWRFVSVEYEYVIASGEMTMEAIYGRRQRVMLADLKLSDVEFCGPAEEEYLKKLSDPSIKKVIKSCSSMKANELYFMIFKDKKGEKTAMYFDAMKKAVDIIYFYAKDVTVKSDKLTF